MESNVYHFKDLPVNKQNELLDYIDLNYSHAKAFNLKRTAYGLKQQFTRIHGDAETHVTSQCFMEAMLKAGFKAKRVPCVSEPNWHFNVKLLKR